MPTHRPSLPHIAALASLATLIALPMAAAQVPRAQTRPDPSARSSVIDRIRDEGLNRSQAMQTLSYLTDVIGPRLTGSPNLKRANEWTRDKLKEWGLENAHLESWGPFGRGWTLKRFSLQVIEPQTIILIAYPKAWTPGFEKPFIAPVILLDAKTDADLDNYEGKLKGAVVLAGGERPVEAHFDALATRNTDTDLLKLADASSRTNALLGRMRAGGPPDRGQAPDRATGRQRGPTRDEPAARGDNGPTSRPADGFPGRRGGNRFIGRILSFAADEGAALIIDASSRGDGGTVFVAGASVPAAPGDSPFDPRRPRVYAVDCPKIPAQATMAAEDYNRLVRMIKQGQELTMAVDLQVQYHTDDLMAYNTIAEIPGTDPELKEQIVMAGGHMDSWQSGTGATDNGVGVVVAMEAVRILKALDLKPRRTIRIGLWTGEEQGLLGSRAYVTEHFGSYPAGSFGGPERMRRNRSDEPSDPVARGDSESSSEDRQARPDASRRAERRRGAARERASRRSEPASDDADHAGDRSDRASGSSDSAEPDAPRRSPRARPEGAEPARSGNRAAAEADDPQPRRNRPRDGAARDAGRPARPARELTRGPDYEKLSVYFNLDNGTGKIRGVYMQGNEAARPYFREWLEPFADLGASTLTSSNTGSTDHISFDAIGLPGFQFIQDPIEYSTRTHHSSADVYDRIQADDVRQAATIMAAFLYDAAQMDERFPRKPAR